MVSIRINLIIDMSPFGDDAFDDVIVPEAHGYKITLSL